VSRLAIRSAEVAWPPLDAPVRLFVVDALPDGTPPSDVAIVLDLSGSLAGPPAARARAFVSTLVAAFHPARHVALVLAGQPPTLAVPLGIRDEPGWAIALARDVRRGPTTLASALELARLELRTRPAPDACVVVSDLAWGPASLDAVARLEAGGTAVLPVEATSAFTPAQPARGALARIDSDEAIAAAVRTIADALRASEPPVSEGSLAIELDAPPLAWFSGEPLRASAPGALASARTRLELGAARVAFAVRGDARGKASLDTAAPQHATISASAASPLEDAATLARTVRAARGDAP
jgi:hypothetical protein